MSNKLTVREFKEENNQFFYTPIEKQLMHVTFDEIVSEIIRGEIKVYRHFSDMSKNGFDNIELLHCNGRGYNFLLFTIVHHEPNMMPQDYSYVLFPSYTLVKMQNDHPTIIIE